MWDNMKKNGFTLVELLVVIILLGLIVTLFIPNVIKILKQNNTKIYKIKENELVNACNDYINYDKDFTFEGTEKYITMDTLVSKNYMSKIIDTSSGNECKAFAKVTKNKVNGYDVEACLICDEYVSENSFCTRDAYNDL